MHYEQHVQEIDTIFKNPTDNVIGKATTDLDDLRDTADGLLQMINRRKGKIISVTPITQGYFDHGHNFDNYDLDTIYGWGYGWGMSFTRALLYIVEYPD